MNKNIVLSVEKLKTGYGMDNITLKDASFNIFRGELVGIIGKNGAGKSTLLKTLRGMIKPLTGEIRINGTLSTELTDKEFACEVAYLQQSMEMSFGYKNKEIVMAGRYPRLQWWESEREIDKIIVEACMEYTGTSHLANKSIHAISGGQRQRVLLAKVLAQQTPILFLDEPSTGLDVFYQEEIFRFCRELCNAGKTILMVIHELSLASRFCSRLMLIGEQKILADDIPEKVLTEINLSKAYQVPIRVVTNPITGSKEFVTKSFEIDDYRSNLLKTIIGGK